MQIRVLTKRDLEPVLSMKHTIDAVEDGFKQFCLEQTIMPQRTAIRVEKNDGVLLVMPAYIPQMNALTTKQIAVFPKNPREHNLPSTIGLVVINDPETGEPQAVMDGAYITAMRTGAVSGIATKYLSREDSTTVAVIGAGAQAKTQLLAVHQVRNVSKVRVYDAIDEASKKYSKEMSQRLGLGVVAVDSSKHAITGADIIITCSTATEPVFDGNWISEGSHINGIGSHRPNARELDTTTIKRSKLVVDSRPACLAEAGDIMIPISEGAITENHIHADLGEIILGKKPGRISRNEITLFKSVGLAIQDASAASVAYKLALEKNVGKMIDV
jgi:alanine dehydrogenase